jgi:dUTP pyrophosphatase
METIKFKLLHPDAKLPSRAHATDAAFDVIAVSREIKDGYISYGLGFSTEIPAGWEAKVYPRSSISNYDLILCNGVGVIDSAYRGEWGARFRFTPKQGKCGWQMGNDKLGTETNVSFDEVYGYAKLYEIGDRIAQIQFQPVPQVCFEVVDELNDSARATGGFGSTGA